MLTPAETLNLIEVAKKFRRHSFLVRSRHRIGAAVLTSDGQIYGGCIIQSVISGLGVCAERSAIDHAVVNGHCQIAAIAVVDHRINYPCGACLQYLLQFYQVTKKDITIICSDLRGNCETSSLLKLLPHGYQTRLNLKTICSNTCR
jgi:cytidine deaminase